MVVQGLNSSPQHGGILAPGTGLELPARLSFETWLRIGQQLSAIASSSAWCLGDWLSYGQATYTSRYRDAIEQTSLEYQTLRNYAWVARRFPLSRRRDNLSFGHHAEVAALPEPEQDFWLRKAGSLGWSRNHLRSQIRESLRERQLDPATDGPGQLDHPPSERQPKEAPEQAIEITMPPDQLDLWHQAAARQHLTIQAWAASVLDRAARRTLQEGQGDGEADSAMRDCDREAS
jgi:hypothetical protein